MIAAQKFKEWSTSHSGRLLPVVELDARGRSRPIAVTAGTDLSGWSGRLTLAGHGGNNLAGSLGSGRSMATLCGRRHADRCRRRSGCRTALVSLTRHWPQRRRADGGSKQRTFRRDVRPSASTPRARSVQIGPGRVGRAQRAPFLYDDEPAKPGQAPDPFSYQLCEAGLPALRSAVKSARHLGQ